MKQFTLTDALKARDNKAVFATLVEAENEYRAIWKQSYCSSITEGYGQMYAGNRLVKVLDDYLYKFACDLRENEADKFSIEEWVDCMCIGAVDAYVNKDEIYCPDAGDIGCLPCCYRNVSLAAFLKTMFTDAGSIVEECSRILDEAA